jgi:intracellular septation protein
MEALSKLLPVLVFVAAYLLADMYFAIAALIVVTALQVAWSWLRFRKVEKSLLLNFVAAAAFGGMALAFQDTWFIVLRASAIYWALAAALLFWQFVLRKNPIEALMGAHFRAPASVWTRWLVRYAVFFILLGIVNLVVARTFSEAVWLSFDTVGVFAIIAAFMFGHVLVMKRHEAEAARPAPGQRSKCESAAYDK